MTQYKLTTKDYGSLIPVREYVITIEDGYVARTQPLCRQYLGMRAENFLTSARQFNDTVIQIEPRQKNFVISWAFAYSPRFTAITAFTPEEALKKFLANYPGQAPVRIYEETGTVDAVNTYQWRP